MNIDELKEQKKENFKNGLIGFLEEYKSAQNNLNSFNRHSDNCGNQARKVAEAFCRYVILSSDKPIGQKEHHAKQEKLRNLLDTVTSTQNGHVYIENENDRKHLKIRLERILDIGNEASHENNIVLTQYDLDEIKNSLLYLSNYIFGQAFTENITIKILHKSNKKTKYKQYYIIVIILFIISIIFFLAKDNSSQEATVKGDTNKIMQTVENTTGSQKIDVEGSGNELNQIKNNFDTKEICQDSISQYQKNIDELTKELHNTKDEKTKVAITKELKESKNNMKNLIAHCSK